MLEKRRGRKVSEDFSTERQREGKRTYLLRSTPGRDPQLPSQKDEGSFMSSQTPSKGTEGRERKEAGRRSALCLCERDEKTKNNEPILLKLRKASVHQAVVPLLNLKIGREFLIRMRTQER